MLIEFYFTPELHLKDGRITAISTTRQALLANRDFGPASTSVTKVLHNIETRSDSRTRSCCSTFVRAVAGGARRALIAARAEARAAGN